MGIRSAPFQIKVGDRVRVKPSVTTPKYKWGSVSHASVGVVTEISGGGGGGRANGNGDVRVDFPQQNKWVGLLAEMERVPACHAGVTCDGCQAGPLMGPRFRDAFQCCCGVLIDIP